MPQELFGRGMLQHVAAHSLVAAIEIAELRHIKRVVHEPHVEDEVGGRWKAVLVAEARDVHEHRALSRAIERVERVAEILHRQVCGVDHLVGALAELDQKPALLVDRRLHPARGIDRMAMPGLAVATEQDVI